MPIDIDQATANIIKTIDNLTALQSKKGEILSSLVGDTIKQKRQLELKRQEKQIMDPFQQALAQKFATDNPGVDFSNIPGFPARPAVATPAAVGQPEINPFEPAKPEVNLTASGFTMRTPGQKEYIYKRIQEKKSAGQPLTQKEISFEEGFLGIRRGVESLKPEDVMRIRTLAKEMATNAGELNMSEEVISQYMPKAKAFLYPDAKDDDEKNLALEGRTATNPKTGQKIIYKDGKWQALK